MSEKQSRYALLAAAAVTFVVLGTLAGIWFGKSKPPPQDPFPVIENLGGDFTLTGPGGTKVGLRDYRGKVVLVFFGYTHCPDVCPTTLYRLKQAMEHLGKQAGQVQVVMITLDPGRDTAARLQQYMTHFHPGFIGLTGSPKEIAAVAKKYVVLYRKDKPAKDGSYGIGHSAFIIALDRRGRTRVVYDSHSKPAKIARDIKRLLAE